MEKLTPVHIGLMGHIDHGKTELARALSERVSTAGLDKHPQAKERGITIDLGFTMFVLDNYLVTLVDAPGHADLIRSVVASANIIDAAILVVAADEGPMIQTGEHIVVLQAMGIDTIVVALTKSDLVSQGQLEDVRTRVQTILEGLGFKRVEYVSVSAPKTEGIDKLRSTLLDVIVPKQGDVDGALLMPIDHAFSVKGHGTVTTGTILRGTMRVGEDVKILPLGSRANVRSIQTFGTEREVAKVGDRVGVNLPDVSHSDLNRGDYVCAGKCPEKSKCVFVRLTTNPLYRGRVSNRMVLSATIGMPSVTAQIVSFSQSDSERIVMDEVVSSEFDAALLLKSDIAVEVGMKVLLIRTDLPPTSMRIVASGSIIDIPESVRLKVRKERIGHVSRVRDEDVLVEGLSSSKQRAILLAGSPVSTKGGVKGTIDRPFGTRGVLSVQFDGKVKEGDKVVYVLFKEEEFRFGG